MDFSKLPKMSQSPAPPPTPTGDPMTPAPPAAAYAQPGAMGIEYALVMAGLGGLLMFFFIGPSNIFSYYFTATPPVFINPDGSTADYRALPNYWCDLATTLFLLLMVANGLLSGLTRSRAARYLLAGGAAAVAMINLYTFVITRPTLGPQLINALAVIVSAIITIASVRWLAADRATRGPATN